MGGGRVMYIGQNVGKGLNFEVDITQLYNKYNISMLSRLSDLYINSWSVVSSLLHVIATMFFPKNLFLV